MRSGRREVDENSDITCLAACVCKAYICTSIIWNTANVRLIIQLLLILGNDCMYKAVKTRRYRNPRGASPDGKSWVNGGPRSQVGDAFGVVGWTLDHHHHHHHQEIYSVPTTIK